jgi:uroporphyrinogen decarboxylase
MIEGVKSKSHNGIKKFMYQNPLFFDAVLQQLVQASFFYVKEQIRSGADVIQVFESWAGVLPPAYFQRYIARPVIQLVQEVKREFPDVPVIIFPKGASSHYSSYISSGLFEGITLDHQVSFSEVIQEFSDKICFQGGIDPAVLMAGGEILKATLFQVLNTFRDQRYICNLSHGLDPETPLENIVSFVQYVREWEKS